jgi:hypothetical protein
MTDPGNRFCDNCAHAQAMDVYQGQTETYRCNHPVIARARMTHDCPDWIIDKNEFSVRSHGQHCHSWKDEIHRDVEALISYLDGIAKNTITLDPDDARLDAIADTLELVKHHLNAAKKIRDDSKENTL